MATTNEKTRHNFKRDENCIFSLYERFDCNYRKNTTLSAKAEILEKEKFKIFNDALLLNPLIAHSRCPAWILEVSRWNHSNSLKCFGNTVTACTASHDIDLSVTKSSREEDSTERERERERERDREIESMYACLWEKREREREILARFIVYTRCANELQFVSNLSRE